jgi:hypothetical protein
MTLTGKSAVPKPDSSTFDFIKISVQIIIKFQKFGKLKNNLIYAKMMKVLQY